MTATEPGRLERSLTILLLASLALAQPLFDLLGSQAEFLVAHDLGGARLLIFALLLGVLLPALLASLPLLAGRIHRGLGQGLFLTLFLALLALTALPPLKSMGLQGGAAVSAAVGCAVLGLGLYRRVAPVRLFFTYLSPAALIFPVAFLFFSRATPLLHAETRADSVALAETPDIVFLVLDEFPVVSLLTPELEIDRQRFPNFARLAGQSNWYLAATTGAEVTVDAVPEALTSTAAQPDVNRLPISANFPRSLFTLLGQRYAFHVTETNTRLCPRSLCVGEATVATGLGTPGLLASDLWLVYRHLVLPRPWSEHLPPVSNGWAGFGQEAVAVPAGGAGLEQAIAIADLAGQVDWSARKREFEQFIDGIQAGDRPQLHFFHSLLPHRVWRYLPDGRQYLVDEVWEVLAEPGPEYGDFAQQAFGHIWRDDPVAVHTARKRHLLQVQFVDTLLGRLLDHLQDQGMLQDSLLVVMGDHGASFLPGQPRRAITDRSRSDIAGVPLFIKFPGQSEGRRIDSPARLLDILPTLAESLGAAPGWAWDGASLLGPVPASRDSVRVKSQRGEALEYPAVEHLEHLLERSASHALTYGSGEIIAYHDLPWSGPLLGCKPESFPRAAGQSGKAFLQFPQLYRDVARDSGFIPLHLEGWIEDLSPESFPLDFVVSINGVIRAAGRTFDIPDFAQRFEALLPPDSLAAGPNALSLYRVEHADGGPRLVELARPLGRDYRLEAGPDGETIHDAEHPARPVRAAPADAVVASYEPEGGGLVSLAGTTGSSLPRGLTVIAFAAGRLAGLGQADGGQFEFPVSGSGRTSARASQVRVFALTDAEAYELGYPPECSKHWHFGPPQNWSGASCTMSATTPLNAFDGGYHGGIDFRAADVRQYLASGWAVEPGNITWTVHQRAAMQIPLPADIGGLQFRAEVSPFLAPPELAEQQLYVLVNGIPAAEFQLTTAEYRIVEWRASAEDLARSPGTLHLDFLVPNARSPQSLGAGSDLRLLGVAFTELWIESAAD